MSRNDSLRIIEEFNYNSQRGIIDGICSGWLRGIRARLFGSWSLCMVDVNWNSSLFYTGVIHFTQSERKKAEQVFKRKQSIRRTRNQIRAQFVFLEQRSFGHYSVLVKDWIVLVHLLEQIDQQFALKHDRVPFRRRVCRSMMKSVVGKWKWLTCVDSHARATIPRKTRKPTA